MMDYNGKYNTDDVTRGVICKLDATATPTACYIFYIIYPPGDADHQSV